jgi:hypothetical protein
MSPPIKAFAAALVAGIIAVSMTACSEDLPTTPAEKQSPGRVQADVTAQAVPANDDFSAATVISAIPYTNSISTIEATSGDGDPLGFCDAAGPTVWYQFTPTADMRLNANTFGSDYDTVLLIVTGTPGDFNVINCNDDVGGRQSSITFQATAGTTYYFMVGSFVESNQGGNLVFNLDEGPPPLELALTVSTRGTVNARTGVATITGTVSCNQPALVDVFADVQQRVGRTILNGFFDTGVSCDGLTNWQVNVSASNGLFVAGQVTVSAAADAEDPVTGDFVTDRATATVRLRGK